MERQQEADIALALKESEAKVERLQQRLLALAQEKESQRRALTQQAASADQLAMTLSRQLCTTDDRVLAQARRLAETIDEKDCDAVCKRLWDLNVFLDHHNIGVDHSQLHQHLKTFQTHLNELAIQFRQEFFGTVRPSPLERVLQSLYAMREQLAGDTAQFIVLRGRILMDVADQLANRDLAKASAEEFKEILHQLGRFAYETPSTKYRVVQIHYEPETGCEVHISVDFLFMFYGQ